MSRVSRLMAGASTAVTRPAVMHRHLAGIQGTEHLPRTGPCVVVANHTSFADHLILDALFEALRDTRTYYLTKAEAFEHPLRRRWTDGMGGIPVDRDRPGRELLAVIDEIFASGSALVVYPEGTRNTGSGLLPFKDGAFRFADRAGVPVVPAAMWGAQDILPKGAKLPRRAQARVAFGPPLGADPSLARPQRIAAATEEARTAITGLLDNTRRPTAESDRASAQHLAERAEAVVETMLSRTDTLPSARRTRQARLLLHLARTVDPDNVDARVTRARLAGLRALDAPAPLRPFLMRGVRRHAQHALRRDSGHLMASYVLGRWHLMTPRLLGGRPQQALHHLREAARLGADDTRYPMAYAEGLLARGHTAQAFPVLRAVLDTPAPDARTQRRRLRAQGRYDALAGDQDPTPTGRRGAP